MKTLTSLSLFGALAICSSDSSAARPAEAPVARHAFDLRGGYVIVGNTLAQDCRAGVGKPNAGTVGPCGVKTDDTGTDVFWAIEAGMPATNLASQTISPKEASARTILVLPTTATVRHAQLYWGAAVDKNTKDEALAVARLDRLGRPEAVVKAERSWTLARGGFDWYQSTAEVTTLVADWGAGAYDLSGIALRDIRNEDNEGAFAGFSLVVVYEDSSATASLQSVTLFDGFDLVEAGSTGSTTVSGFVVPDAATKASLGVVAYEGDNGLGGDSLRLDGVPLSDAENPADNFFNGTRGTFGTPASTPGDAPGLTGKADSMSGLDIDVIDVASALLPGRTSAKIEPRSTMDAYAVGVYVFGIAAPRPTLDVVKSVAPSPAEVLWGDTVRYEIAVTNSGAGPALAPTVRDILPPGLTYTPGTLTLFRGAPSTPIVLSDASDGDVGQYDAGTRELLVFDGSGQIAPGATWTVSFDAKVNVGTLGKVLNEAAVSVMALGARPGDPPIEAGSHPPGGSGPTSIFVHECAGNADCTDKVCDLTTPPHICIAGAGGGSGQGGAAGAAGSAAGAGSGGSGTAGTGGGAGKAGGSGAAGNGGAAGDPGTAGKGGAAGVAGAAGQGGIAGNGGSPGSAGAGGSPVTGGQAGKAGRGGEAGAAGVGAQGGASGTGGKGGAAGQTAAGTGGRAGTGGTLGQPGSAGTGGSAGALLNTEGDRFQGSGISCAVESRGGAGGSRLGGWAALIMIGVARLRRRARRDGRPRNSARE